MGFEQDDMLVGFHNLPSIYYSYISIFTAKQYINTHINTAMLFFLFRHSVTAHIYKIPLEYV